MKRLLFPVFVFFAAMSLSAKETHCVLPPPDGSDVEWSSPSVVGRLEMATPGEVVIRTAAGKVHTVVIGRKTQLFTAFGGGIEPGQLKAGQYASVWLKDCRPPGKSHNRAAVVQVCSLLPEPCPK